MDKWIPIFVTMTCSIIASSGFWTYIIQRSSKKDVRYKLIKGLAHDRILSLGVRYIERGWITPDEYENIHAYLYEPYKAMGGNGSAERVMNKVTTLPMRKITEDHHEHQ